MHAKKISIILGVLILLIAYKSDAALSIFTSGQVGSNPVNGYILQTDGSKSSWVANTGGDTVGSGNVATSSAETSTYVPFWTSTAGTPATLSGGDSGFSWNNTLKRLNLTSLGIQGSTYGASFTASSTQTEDTPYYLPIDKGLPGQMLTNINGTQLGWKNADIQGLVQYYDTNWTSDIAGAYVENVNQATTTTVYLTSGSLSGNDNLINTFVTPSGTPGLTTIPAGQWVYHFRALKNAAPNTRIYAEVYKRSESGTETKLMTTSQSNYLSFVEENYDVSVSTSTITLLTTDRLEVKVYANIGGSGVMVQQAIMGGTQSGLRLPVLFQPGYGLPGGSNTQVQFNDSGVFGGSSLFTFNKTSGHTTFTSASSSRQSLSSALWLTPLVSKLLRTSADGQVSETTIGTGLTFDGTTIASSITQYTDALARASLSETVTGIDYNNSTGEFSDTSGYGIPLTASTTEWYNFNLTPSSRITAGNDIDWSGNTLNVLDSWYNSSSDVIGGFSSCSGIQYLGADGACHDDAGGTSASSTLLADNNTWGGLNTFTRIGVGIAPDTLSSIKASSTVLTSSQGQTGFSSLTNLRPSANNLTMYGSNFNTYLYGTNSGTKNYGLGFSSSNFNTNTTAINSGIFGLSDHQSVGTTTLAFGGAFSSTNNQDEDGTTGLITTAYGVTGDVSTFTGAQGITNAYALAGQVNHYGGGVITSGYGLYLPGNSGTITNSYGLYQAGASDKNYFAGKVGIATTSPYAPLSVVGQTVSSYFTSNDTTSTSTFHKASTTDFKVARRFDLWGTAWNSITEFATYIKSLFSATYPLTYSSGVISLSSDLSTSTSKYFLFSKGMRVATTTAWTGTSTPAIFYTTQHPLTVESAYCPTYSAGTLGISLSDGTNRANYIPTASTTANLYTFTSGNTFSVGESLHIEAGNPASSPTAVTCTFNMRFTN